MKNLFTGWRSPDLTRPGNPVARRKTGRAAGGEALGLHFDEGLGHGADPPRQNTMGLMLAELEQLGLSVAESQGAERRDYGDLAG